MGYKNELFLKTVDENLCCSICRQIFQEPVSCKSGHTFCLLCIWEWLRTRNKCPLDNVALAEQDLVQNLAIRGIVENLEVSCHNDDQSDESMGPEPAKKPRGENGHSSDEQEKCDWTGKLCDLQRHQLTCSFQLTYCPNSTYCKKIQKRKLEEHKKMCEYRTVACRLCGKSLAYNDRLKHKNEECPLELVSCTNKCETSYGTITKIQRCYLDEHVNSACDKAIIDCSFSGQGCSEQLLRKDLEKHLQDKMSSHMLLLAAENKLLKRELARVKEPNKTFVWSIEDYRNEANKYQTGSSFSSPMFWLCGYKWKLSLYPKGKVDERFLTLMLNRVDWGCKTQQPNQIICEALHAHVVCSISVLKAKPTESDFVRTFNVTMPNDAENWMNGWSDFMPATHAVSSKYCSQAGVLNIQCTMQITYT